MYDCTKLLLCSYNCSLLTIMKFTDLNNFAGSKMALISFLKNV
jgi:hypothetical protein